MSAGTVVPSGPVALLIDADNLSAPEMVAQALRHLTQLAGPVGIRRAYGSAENLKGLSGVLREFAFHLCVNLPLAKNTTDMALAVDAMDLCARYAPGVLAIGTGDADFAPLVLRLRERGVRTVCFSQANKMSPEVHGFYDEVVLLGARRSAAASVVASVLPVAAPAAAPAPARKTAARKTPARKTAAKSVAEAAPAPAPARVPAPPPSPAPAPVPASPAPAPAPEPAPVSARAAAAAAKEAELSERVQALLREMPGVTEGHEVDFGEVAKRLREAKLLGRQAVMSKFLKKHVPGVELTPQAQPRKLRWAPGPA
ncbi:NYN domain-containing protein [Pseudorhodoferax sp. Leaf274]|uniref:NYN domain-containing protein n=1 Tax=Pseudorhodoferax sp. Leaf274 TaxID=1736318 RepID=UPI0007034A13|nr:NYN domain-containing protein [Pseudorhodoferax sp. Leaf274]KQP37888.1 hypothetical protein ASF44_11690 [Pseudorhodoferax sp. Leaf274]